MKQLKQKSKKGITLIALVVTIVVLLILAGITITILFNENGIVKKAQEAVEKTIIEQEKEALSLTYTATQTDILIAMHTNKKEELNQILSNLENLIEQGLLNYGHEAKVIGLVVSGTIETNMTQEQAINHTEIKIQFKETNHIYNMSLKSGMIRSELKSPIIKVSSGFVLRESGSITMTEQFGNENETFLIESNIVDKGAIDVGAFLDYNEELQILYYIDTDKKLYTLGKNNYGQLGDGTTTDSSTPICISDIPESPLNGKKIVKAGISLETSYAIDEQGKLYTWGRDNRRNFEATSSIHISIPICISDITGSLIYDKKIIDAGVNYAIDEQRKLYAWGLYAPRKSRDINYSEEICISDIPGNPLYDKKVIKANVSNSSYVIDEQGKLYTWGSNQYGQLGNGDKIGSSIPICISDIPENPLYGKKIRQANVDCSSYAIDEQGKLYTWGENFCGQLGNGTKIESSIPICISDIPENPLYSKKIKNAMIFGKGTVVDDENKLYYWGYYANGEYITLPVCSTESSDSSFYQDLVNLFFVDNAENGYIISLVTNSERIYKIYNKREFFN